MISYRQYLIKFKNKKVQIYSNFLFLNAYRYENSIKKSVFDYVSTQRQFATEKRNLLKTQ